VSNYQRQGAVAGGILAAAFLFACLQMTKTVPDSWNEMSRVAAIESFVERGTWAIDQSPWMAKIGDRAFIRGRFYSDKMPLLNLLGAGVYAVMHWGWGATLAPTCGQSGVPCAYYGLTLILIGLPGVALVWLFFRFLLKQQVTVWTAAAATAALAFGSMVWPYSLVINHHLPSATALFASFYLLKIHPNPLGWFFAGLFAALAVSFDFVSVIMCAGLLALAVGSGRHCAMYFGSGALVPLLITGVLDYQITGTLLPPYLVRGAYVFPGSRFADTPGGVSPPANLPQYAFNMLLGNHGLYAFAPILFFGLAGTVMVAVNKTHPLRREAICIASSYLAATVYLVTQTANLGGAAYGVRFYLHAVPLIMVFAAFGPLASARWQRLVAVTFAVLLIVSAASSYQGARHPWRYSPPLAYLTRDAGTGAIGWSHFLVR
jgi:hypothetical protein